MTDYVKTQNVGFVSVPMLECFWGEFWSPVVNDFLRALRPSSVCFSKGGIVPLVETPLWQVTVYLDDQERILRIEQEVEVSLSSGAENGHDLTRRAANINLRRQLPRRRYCDDEL